MYLQPAGFAVDADVSTVARFVELVKTCAGVELDWIISGVEREPVIRWSRRRNAALREAIRARIIGIYEGLTGERATFV
jgi:hypothetical protein